jgi:hypothetical protein
MAELAGALRDALGRSDASAGLLRQLGGESGEAASPRHRRLVCDRPRERRDRQQVLGAGGGGFRPLYAPEQCHPAICAAIPELRSVNIRFEPQGSRLIYVEENGYA